MDEFVGQGEVTDGVVVLVSIEIVAIAAKGFSKPMAVIKHRRHAIEAETIEVELFEPIFAVGE